MTNRTAYKRSAWVSDNTSSAATVPTKAHHRAGSNEHRAIEGHGGNTAVDGYLRAKGRDSQTFSEYLPKGSDLANCFRCQSKLEHARK